MYIDCKNYDYKNLRVITLEKTLDFDEIVTFYNMSDNDPNPAELEPIPIEAEGDDMDTKNNQTQQSMKPSIANHKSDDVWNSLFGLVVSIIGGSYIGLSSRSMRESWIYCIILIFLSIVCFLTTITARKYSVRKAVSPFIIYFVIGGLTSPIASYLGIQLV